MSRNLLPITPASPVPKLESKLELNCTNEAEELLYTKLKAREKREQEIRSTQLYWADVTHDLLDLSEVLLGSPDIVCNPPPKSLHDFGASSLTMQL